MENIYDIEWDLITTDTDEKIDMSMDIDDCIIPLEFEHSFNETITEHGNLIGRDEQDQHPIGAISGLEEALQNISPKVDDKSIEKSDSNVLSIKNVGEARQGQVPAYDSADGIVWIDPISDLDLRNAVAEAETYANRSIVASNQSSNYSIESEKSANKSKAYADSILGKFWFGTSSEYNKLIYIDPDVIYVIIT